MARTTGRPAKKPGRVKQMIQVFQMTRKADPSVTWWVLLAFLLPVLGGVVLALTVAGGNVLSIITMVLLGIVTGLLVALIVLGRRAESAAYAQIEGQPGAVGAVLRSSLRRGWRGSEVPVAVNPRTRDAVYRAIGRPGVVLIAEGPKGRTQRLVEEERRKVQRVAPNVPVSVIRVGPDEDAVPLGRINRRLGRLKPRLTRAEVLGVSNRLESMKASVPMPKGVDPTKLRPVRR
ncbi:DUF4191 domain-containing protein [Amnibacterium endophyticum]|uniref:DUF4191 domain-containing protein n=1 Tax=Amnibacterium endophyticum TaxID=2109337 RepID=A0ABW4LHZ5_9MICO